ncbi:aminomethyl-transferring glycine dehydrogenase subunit GcvPA [bacterium]|nr:aminomethyl-transferring glycine dehydrogenase subunit GcvPA [bacterium]
MRYLPHTEDSIATMLESVGAKTLDDLFSHLPGDCVMKGPLNLPAAMNEWELNRHMDALASTMCAMPDCTAFLGAGCYEHYVPTVVSNLLGRSEFLTAYTPYQPEVSQGTLQGIYEYQTLVCRLLGMEVANASMYDGASALAEAVLMAFRITRKRKVALSRAVHPLYRDVVKTYLTPLGFEIVEIPFGEDGRTDLAAIQNTSDLAAVAVQSPNFFGCVEDLTGISGHAHRNGALSVVSFTEPIAYGLLKNPGSQGADIVCGEGRSLGLTQSFGGVSLGMFAAKMDYARSMPGRLVGKTVDKNGRRGFVITLSTREQHIRREKATSNICSNQSLCALGAAMYMACLGRTGLRDLARINYNKAQYFRELLNKAGFETRFESPVFNEFVVRAPRSFEQAYNRLAERKIVAGLPLAEYYPELEGCYLMCVTETKTKDDIDGFVKEVKACLNR